jgi:NTE family protein
MAEQGVGTNRSWGRHVDLVFEGGGVKGIALVGAYSVLEEEGYEPQNMAGASAGAIVAALIAAGYTSDELKEIISKLDYDQFKDEALDDRFPLGKALSILRDLGIYEGKTPSRSGCAGCWRPRGSAPSGTWSAARMSS